MTPSLICTTCGAGFAGHAQGITFYQCEGKAFFGTGGLTYSCGAPKIKPQTTQITQIKNGVAVICEACHKNHMVADNCCIKIQCPCGNQIKTCSS